MTVLVVVSEVVNNSGGGQFTVVSEGINDSGGAGQFTVVSEGVNDSGGAGQFTVVNEGVNDSVCAGQFTVVSKGVNNSVGAGQFTVVSSLWSVKWSMIVVVSEVVNTGVNDSGGGGDQFTVVNDSGDGGDQFTVVNDSGGDQFTVVSEGVNDSVGAGLRLVPRRPESCELIVEGIFAAFAAGKELQISVVRRTAKLVDHFARKALVDHEGHLASGAVGEVLFQFLYCVTFVFCSL
ncbi:hypothetical protein ACOMHN_009218 [Nucella lapillus]